MYLRYCRKRSALQAEFPFLPASTDGVTPSLHFRRGRTAVARVVIVADGAHCTSTNQNGLRQSEVIFSTFIVFRKRDRASAAITRASDGAQTEVAAV